MTPDFAIVVAFLVLSVTIVFLLRMLASRRQQAQADDMRAQAGSRGWTFEAVREGAYQVHRWRGATDGIEWVAESMETPSRNSKHQTRLARWRTTSIRGPLTVIVCMGVPEGKEKPDVAVAQGDGWLATLARKAAGFALDIALTRYFGDEAGLAIDAAALRPVEGAIVPGFVVMALDPSEASRLLFQGLDKKLEAATHDPDSALSDASRPWALLWPQGIGLGRMDVLRRTADVERFVHGGVALAKAARF